MMLILLIALNFILINFHSFPFFSRASNSFKLFREIFFNFLICHTRTCFSYLFICSLKPGKLWGERKNEEKLQSNSNLSFNASSFFFNWNSLFSRPLMNLKFHFNGKFFNYLIIRCVLLWTKRGNDNNY